MKAARRFKIKLHDRKGAVAIIVALLLVVLIGFVALAVDVGYMMVVRNQLQNAADASALAGCNKFFERTPVTLPAYPDWDAAEAEASNAISINKSDNKVLSNGVIKTGWWDITQSATGKMWPDPLTSPLPLNPPTANYGPAINVTIEKAPGQNSGPILTFFANILGIDKYNMRATATAVAASPGSARPGSLIPVAISKRLADRADEFDNAADYIVIGSPYHYDDFLAGQWTSFNLDRNDTTTVRGLISDGNATSLTIGENIWIQPGVKDTLYDSTTQYSIDRNYAGKDVFIPIIDANVGETTHSSVPLVGFIGFHVICAGKGCDGTEHDPNPDRKNEAIIVGYFTTAAVYGGPVGPYYGPLDRCRLAQ